jgi:uncharacterized Rmd1/YagE family protein
MIAFSSGLIRSVRLSVFEAQADEVVMPLKDIMDTLSSTGVIAAGTK